MQNPFRSEQLVLGGKYLLVTEDTEYRMSHWVKEFGLYQVANHQPVLEIVPAFDLEFFSEKHNLLVIRFNVYSHPVNTFEVEIDPEKGRFLYQSNWCSLADFHRMFKNG